MKNADCNVHIIFFERAVSSLYVTLREPLSFESRIPLKYEQGFIFHDSTEPQQVFTACGDDEQFASKELGVHPKQGFTAIARGSLRKLT